MLGMFSGNAIAITVRVYMQSIMGWNAQLYIFTLYLYRFLNT